MLKPSGSGKQSRLYSQNGVDCVKNATQKKISETKSQIDGCDEERSERTRRPTMFKVERDGEQLEVC